ncbi:MAG: IS1634 family transposase [Chloroflexota bacterium]
MFLRTVKARGRKGEKHEYLRLVESVWENGRSKQRVVASLGRKDLLAPHLDDLVRLLGDGEEKRWVRAAEVVAQESVCWGPFLVISHLWRELGLEEVLDGIDGSLADRALVLVAGRLCRPASEHGLAWWLDTDYVCDRQGRRWLPAWEEHGRVRVNLSWLQRWYRALDKLVEHKEEIEKAMYLKLRDLFSLEVDMVFYDITSSYFEGQGPAVLAEYGYSRDGRPQNRQVLVGMVMVNGWPVAHHVFPGNLPDAGTVEEVVEDLEKRFGLRRVLFVGDRGMVTTDNIELLRQKGHGYLVGLQRRHREEVYHLIEQATGEWLECPSPEKRPGSRTWVQEVKGDGLGVRVFVVQSEERLAYEQAMRLKCMERTQAALERLASRVEKGRLKAPEKIGAAVGRVLSRHHGHRYYGWEFKEGKFSYFEHPNLEREKAYEGKYLIQTEEQHLTAVEAVAAYKELSEVERAFRNLKDVINLRPVYHRQEKRVRGHIFVAALAFLLQHALERKLKRAGVNLCAGEALQALRTVQIVDTRIGDEPKRGCTTGRSYARKVLDALGLTQLSPPQALETI